MLGHSFWLWSYACCARYELWELLLPLCAPVQEKLAAAQARADASRQALGKFICQAAEVSKRGAPGAGKAAVSDKVCSWQGRTDDMSAFGWVSGAA